MNNLFNLKELSEKDVLDIIESAEDFIKGKTLHYGNKVVANLFFEPSTRTQYSFEAAEHRLGCKVLTFNKESSSIQKGETLYDTVKTFSQYADVIVIRHSQNNYYEELIGNIEVPIINGGDGSGNHPTQSLLDLLTIHQEFKHFKGLEVAIVGDIAHSRVANTNIEIMKRLGMIVYCCAPVELQNEEHQYVDLDAVIDHVDIVMLLRVQFERHEKVMDISKEEYHHLYGLTKERYNRLNENAIIMHPAPVNRGIEIADELIESKKSRIFKQMKNGVYIRMALLQRAFEGRIVDDFNKERTCIQEQTI